MLKRNSGVKAKAFKRAFTVSRECDLMLLLHEQALERKP